MNNVPERLHVAILVHSWEPQQLSAVVTSLAIALQPLCEAGLMVRVSLLDNGDQASPQRLAGELGRARQSLPQADWQLHGGLPNHGYGSGHNIALRASRAWGAQWHLVLNPDVLLEPDVLQQGLLWLRSEKRCGLVSPLCRGWTKGEVQYLARTAPSPWVLVLRNMPGRIRAWGWVTSVLQRHVYAEHPQDRPVKDVETQSGCFMLGRLDAFDAVQGFDEAFFMYFEDLDLSLRMRSAGWRIDRAPQMKIAHAGGAAGRKGAAHVRYFMVSALRFFWRHPGLLFGRQPRLGPARKS